MANTNGGGANPQYEFLVNGTVMQAFSTASTYLWTPTPTAASTTYTLSAVAKDMNTPNPTPVTSNTLSYQITAPLTGVSLQVNPTSPRLVNTSITLTATATGGAVPQYQFTATDSSGNITVIQKYSLVASCKWTPTIAQQYNLQVTAQDLNGSTSTKAVKLASISSPAKKTTLRQPMSATLPSVTSLVVPYTIAAQFSRVSLAVNPASPRAVGTPITLTATTTGGALLNYQFLVNNVPVPNGNRLSPTYQWTPTASGPIVSPWW